MFSQIFTFFSFGGNTSHEINLPINSSLLQLTKNHCFGATIILAGFPQHFLRVQMTVCEVVLKKDKVFYLIITYTATGTKAKNFEEKYDFF